MSLSPHGDERTKAGASIPSLPNSPVWDVAVTGNGSPATEDKGAEALRRALCPCPHPHTDFPCQPDYRGPQPGQGGWWPGRGAQGFPNGCIFWISPGIAEVPPGAWPYAARRAPTGFSSLSETSGSYLKRQWPLPAAFHLPPPSPAPPHWDPWDSWCRLRPTETPRASGSTDDDGTQHQGVGVLLLSATPLCFFGSGPMGCPWPRQPVPL